MKTEKICRINKMSLNENKSSKNHIAMHDQKLFQFRICKHSHFIV